MDTVPWETQKGWTKDALKLQIDGDKLYGRGTCDMKLFIAQCLAVFRDFDLTKLKKPNTRNMPESRGFHATKKKTAAKKTAAKKKSPTAYGMTSKDIVKKFKKKTA